MLTKCCSRFFNDDVPKDDDVRSAATALTVDSTDRILENPEEKEGLLKKEEYLVAVLRYKHS